MIYYYECLNGTNHYFIVRWRKDIFKKLADNKDYMWMLLNGKRVFGGRKPTKEETKAYFDMVDKARLNVLLQDDNSKSGQAQWE